MTNMVLSLLGLLLTVPGAPMDDPPTTKDRPVSDRVITRRVDDLLRASGTKLVLDEDRAIGNILYRNETNKIHYYTSTKDHRLVRIEIEPVGEESPGSYTLAATFLHVLEAVGSIDEGVGIAQRLSAELAKDGRTRFVSLSNGVKLIKEKTGDSSVRYIISL